MALRRPLLLAGAFLLLGASAALVHGQGSGPSDTVKYRDRTKDGSEVTKIGEAKESPAGITMVVLGKTLTISPADITNVYYGKLNGVDDKLRLDMPSWDAKGGAAENRNKYADLLKAASGAADERTKRFLEFKVAMWTAKLADGKTGDDFKAEAAAAVDKLVTVARSYNKSWEVWPASRTAARLQAELGKFNDAAATLGALAKTEGLPLELQNEAKIGEVDALYRGGALLAATAAVESLAKASGLTPSQKDRIGIYQVAIQGASDKGDPAKVQAAAKNVRDHIDKIADPAARAVAHNVLGELYLMAKLDRDAMWEFLWVEAVYNQDRDELVKALARLTELFEKQGEKERAAAYREKLLKAKAA